MINWVQKGNGQGKNEVKWGEGKHKFEAQHTPTAFSLHVLMQIILWILRLLQGHLIPFFSFVYMLKAFWVSRSQVWTWGLWVLWSTFYSLSSSFHWFSPLCLYAGIRLSSCQSWAWFDLWEFHSHFWWIWFISDSLNTKHCFLSLLLVLV